MSRVGRQPIPIPDGVTVVREGNDVRVEGPKGALSQGVPAGIAVEIVDGQVRVQRALGEVVEVDRGMLICE